MAVIISMINLKGGVGKTSTTVALAEFLAYEFDKKVLVIDLDPQTNATVALIGEENWKKQNEKDQTLYQLFKDKIDKTNKFNLTKSIIKKVSNIGSGIDGLDLLPSSLGLIDIQDILPLITATELYASNPLLTLKDAVGDALSDYDFVLIDCPPNLGTITGNGLLISNYYLIPSIPDILSTYGIPQILNKVEDFARKMRVSISPLGIVVTMYRSTSRLHQTTIKELKMKSQLPKNPYPKIFKTIIPLSTKAAEAPDYDASPNTIKQKYGYGNSFDIYYSLTKELISNV